MRGFMCLLGSARSLAVRKVAVLAALCALAFVSAPHAQATDVIVSIKPVHSLVSGVMGETGEPGLMVTGAASPHTYQMRPSEAQALNTADLIVWIGENMEMFLERAIENLGADAELITLHEVARMELLPTREGGLWPDEHDEDKEAHVDEHDDHGHEHGEFDMHIWLDPGNASRIVEVTADALIRSDPGRAEIYRSNADAMVERIASLEMSIMEQLEPVKQRAFVVFHDGYQYFEHAFGLNSVGAVAVDPGRPPGTKRLVELRAALVEHDIRCVFIEPQFPPDLVQTLTEGTTVRIAELDPIGVDFEPGPDAWFEMMRSLGDAIAGCLDDA